MSVNGASENPFFRDSSVISPQINKSGDSIKKALVSAKEVRDVNNRHARTRSGSMIVFQSPKNFEVERSASIGGTSFSEIYKLLSSPSNTNNVFFYFLDLNILAIFSQ